MFFRTILSLSGIFLVNLCYASDFTQSSSLDVSASYSDDALTQNALIYSVLNWNESQCQNYCSSVGNKYYVFHCKPAVVPPQCSCYCTDV